LSIPSLVLSAPLPRPLSSTLFPYTTLFRSHQRVRDWFSSRRFRHRLSGAEQIDRWFALPHLLARQSSHHQLRPHLPRYRTRRDRDRKSTRLNSSHVKISYAVFCLKKKRIVH